MLTVAFDEVIIHRLWSPECAKLASHKVKIERLSKSGTECQHETSKTEGFLSLRKYHTFNEKNYSILLSAPQCLTDMVIG